MADVSVRLEIVKALIARGMDCRMIPAALPPLLAAVRGDPADGDPADEGESLSDEAKRDPDWRAKARTGVGAITR